MDSKLAKKHQSMFNNMLTHLKSKKCAGEIVSTMVKNGEEELIVPSHIKGSFGNQEFVIKISSEQREDNGQPQVLLLMKVEENKFVTLKPLTNGQLQFMIEQFVPGTVTHTEPEKVEVKAEAPKAETATVKDAKAEAPKAPEAPSKTKK